MVGNTKSSVKARLSKQYQIIFFCAENFSDADFSKYGLVLYIPELWRSFVDAIFRELLN